MFSLGFEKLVFLISPLPLDRMSKLWSGIYLKRDDAIKEEIGGIGFCYKTRTSAVMHFLCWNVINSFP